MLYQFRVYDPTGSAYVVENVIATGFPSALSEIRCRFPARPIEAITDVHQWHTGQRWFRPRSDGDGRFYGQVNDFQS